MKLEILLDFLLLQECFCSPVASIYFMISSPLLNVRMVKLEVYMTFSSDFKHLTFMV